MRSCAGVVSVSEILGDIYLATVSAGKHFSAWIFSPGVWKSIREMESNTSTAMFFVAVFSAVFSQC